MTRARVLVRTLSPLGVNRCRQALSIVNLLVIKVGLGPVLLLDLNINLDPISVFLLRLGSTSPSSILIDLLGPMVLDRSISA